MHSFVMVAVWFTVLRTQLLVHRQQRIKDTWADGKDAGKQLLQQVQEEPALQPALDMSPRQDGFTHKREPQPAFSQTPGIPSVFLFLGKNTLRKCLFYIQKLQLCSFSQHSKYRETMFDITIKARMY